MLRWVCAPVFKRASRFAHPHFFVYPPMVPVENIEADRSARPNSRQEANRTGGSCAERRPVCRAQQPVGIFPGRGGALTGEGDQWPGRPAASLYSLTSGWGRDWVAGPATSASGARFAQSAHLLIRGDGNPDVERRVRLGGGSPLWGDPVEWRLVEGDSPR